MMYLEWWGAQTGAGAYFNFYTLSDMSAQRNLFRLNYVLRRLLILPILFAAHGAERRRCGQFLKTMGNTHEQCVIKTGNTLRSM